LMAVAALIGLMVLVGGATRLTESGLSIVEWKPDTGALPPLSDAQWQDAFEGYKKDRYTTLKETSDRILATAITAKWAYRTSTAPFGDCWQQARETMLKVFVERDSPSVQHTAYAMGEAVLRAVPDVREIRLSLPNKHCLWVDLAPFGLENPNEIFMPVDEPHGLIEVHLRRQV